MMVVAVLFYIVNIFICLWAIEIIIRNKNMWFIFHAVSSLVLSILYVIWYYGEGWIVEALIFSVGGTLLHAYRTAKSESSVSILSGKSKVLTFSLLVVIAFTIVFRILI